MDATKDVELFRVYDDFDFSTEQRYSIYASKDWNLSKNAIGDATNPLKVGFDVGINDHFVSAYYQRGSEVESQTAIINTGACYSLSLQVDSPKDDLHHFGNADSVHVTAIASSSYHEFGVVSEPVLIESGHIVLESGSEVTATVMGEATATKKAGSASSVEYQDHTPGSIAEFRFPSFVMDYLSRTASSRLDSISDIQATPEPNRNNYYRNDGLAKGSEGGADTYVIGNDNELDFPIYGIERDNVTLEERVYKNPSAASLAITRVEGQGTLTWNAGKLNPTGAEPNDVFDIALGTNVFRVKIIDGYNVVDAKGLSLFDNVASIVDENGNNLARYDKWADLKKEFFGDEYYALNPNALVQHGDIKLKNTDLPEDLFWSNEQVKKYLAENPNILSAYTNARNAGRGKLGLEPLTEADVFRSLSGSMRDDTPVFYRATGQYLWQPTAKNYNATADHEGYQGPISTMKEAFVFEGNYFHIDAANLKQIAFFGAKAQGTSTNPITAESGEPMPDLNPEMYSLTEGSNGTLFGFNAVGGYKNNELLPYRGWGGSVNMKNLTVIGNGNRANDTRYQGGLYAFKVDATIANFTNVHVSKAMGSFMSQIGFYKQNTFATELHVDRCKSFDSYSTMFYIYGTEDNTLSNSCIKNAGGPLIMLDERNRYLEAYQGNSNGDRCGFVGNPPTLECENVYLENFVTGTEPFFTSKPPQLVGKLISWLEGHGTDVFAPLGAKNFIKKMSDGNTYMNLLVADMDIGGLAADRTKSKDGWYASPSKGRFVVRNDLDEQVYSAKNANMDLNLGTAQAPTILGIYRAACLQAGSSEGLIFQNALGNHGMSTGQNKETKRFGGMSLDFTNPASPAPAAFDNGLAQADYLSCYLSSNLNELSMMFGFVFGMK